MSLTQHDPGTRQDQWARLRFSIIGSLLASPPESGQLQRALQELAGKCWCHPISGTSVKFGFSTIERWFYLARSSQHPIAALKTKQRADAGRSRVLTGAIKEVIRAQYKQHPGWSCQLHLDNLWVRIEESPELGKNPSYSTLFRYMKACGLNKRRRVRKHTPAAYAAVEHLDTREVRSFESEYVHALWHLDFHHGSRKVLGCDGQWRKPLLLAILDDRSRLICHAQWYLDETAETLVHGFSQAIQKRALPRALMTDNGSAMSSAEFTQGLERLSILHQPTLPYSPYQNAKQEVFWAQLEGRLMAMLEGERELTLSLLNQATLAWLELEYHKKIHSELDCTPLSRYLDAPQVGRVSPDSNTLRCAFRAQVKRKQRKSDGTIALDGHRFEIPSAYRHLDQIHVQYARWNLSTASLIDPHTGNQLATLYPLDKVANSRAVRRVLAPQTNTAEDPPEGIAPLLKKLMADYAATGLPPAYLPKGDTP